VVLRLLKVYFNPQATQKSLPLSHQPHPQKEKRRKKPKERIRSAECPSKLFYSFYCVQTENTGSYEKEKK
jgi:hypothetical protein